MEFPQAAGGRGKIMLRVQQVELRAGRWQLLRMCFQRMTLLRLLESSWQFRKKSRTHT